MTGSRGAEPPAIGPGEGAPPSYGSLPTNLLGLARDPLGFFLHAGRGHDVVRLALGPSKPVFLVNRPDLIEEVLVSRRHQYQKPSGLGDIRTVVGLNLMTSDGYFHQCHRSLAEPAIDVEAVTRFAQVVVDQATQASSRWHEGEVEAHHAMLDLTFRVAGRVLFDTAVEDEPGLEDALEEVLSHCERYTRPLGSVLDRLPMPSTLDMRHGDERLDRFLDQAIARCQGGHGPDSVFGQLMTAALAFGQPALLSDTEWRDEMAFIFLAARETIADVLAWLWSELSQAPDTQQALHEELDSVLHGRPVARADLANLACLDRVVKETLRLWPVGWVVLRETATDYPLGPYLLPGGADVVVSPWVTQRDSRYFDEPDSFRPDRWSTPGAPPSPFSYFPYSAGPRTCLGSHFSAMALPLIVATFAQHWTVDHIRGKKAQPVPHFAIRPAGGVWLRITSRG